MIKIGSIENNEVERCFYREGLIFKDEEAFLNKSGICYVPELSDDMYTYADFLKIANNNCELAKALFYNVCWESPYTLYDMWVNDGEVIECTCCNNVYLTDGDDEMPCPKCNHAPIE